MPLDQVDVDVVEEQKEMSFFEHLEALRWHLIRAIIAIIACALFIFFQKDFVFNEVVYGPRNGDFFTYQFLCRLADWMCFTPVHFDVITRDLAEKFTMHITVSAVLGLIVAFPYVLWETWRFIKPGLYKHERRSARGIVFICSTLFIIGVLFGYYFIAPFALSFLAGYELADTMATPTLNSYINYMIMFTLPIGMIFEMPIVAYFLTKINFIGPQLLKSGRRYAIVIILIVAAILTPSPDVVSQLILAAPLYLLYEVSISVSAAVHRSNLKREKAELEALEKSEALQNKISNQGN